MTLSNTACKSAHKSDKAKDGKAFKLFDDKGLFLLIKPTASGWGKWRRFKYRFDGKEKQYSFGAYPESVSAKQTLCWHRRTPSATCTASAG